MLCSLSLSLSLCTVQELNPDLETASRVAARLRVCSVSRCISPEAVIRTDSTLNILTTFTVSFAVPKSHSWKLESLLQHGCLSRNSHGSLSSQPDLVCSSQEALALRYTRTHLHFNESSDSCRGYCGDSSKTRQAGLADPLSAVNALIQNDTWRMQRILKTLLPVPPFG